jgi:hypothetical protein
MAMGAGLVAELADVDLQGIDPQRMQSRMAVLRERFVEGGQ